jgi:hypothetical protein
VLDLTRDVVASVFQAGGSNEVGNGRHMDSIRSTLEQWLGKCKYMDKINPVE